MRQLEIGPGKRRLPGFETMNIVKGKQVDHVGDAAKKMPFPDNSFDVIYASHILEHIPWTHTDQALKEWVRVLKKDGCLEVFVPNALKIMKAFVDAEEGRENRTEEDGWFRFNDEKDPCKWAAGRTFTYGDGRGTLDHPNWHRALFSPRYLQLVMLRAGLQDLKPMSKKDVRATDHGWINLGFRGWKR